jgi:ribosomal protein L35
VTAAEGGTSSGNSSHGNGKRSEKEKKKDRGKEYVLVNFRGKVAGDAKVE